MGSVPGWVKVVVPVCILVAAALVVIAVAQQSDDKDDPATETMTLVILRHGESEWNKLNIFTGWTDVDLSDGGRSEAAEAGKLLKEEGLEFDVCYTSYLKRAIHTLDIVLDEMDLEWLPVTKSWKLNERHYGALQGLNKAETAEKYGEEQVRIWRRSYDVPPPALDPDDERNPANQEQYKGIPAEELPLTECLKDTVARVVPYFEEEIKPQMLAGDKVIIVAHGNSLRAMVKYLEGISDQDIPGVEIPNGVPIVYEFDKDFNIISKRFLGVQDEGSSRPCDPGISIGFQWASFYRVKALGGTMPFSEDEYVFLEDASGKRYGFRMSFGMLKIPSLGAIDGSRFRDAEDGDTVSIMGKEFTIFRPGAMDMMLSLERGAQIITPKDAETILMHCDVRCGRSVLEVGAGSGGLTTALLHAVAPEGRVHTLELKEENAQRAKRNVSRTGHDRYWSYTIGDAREAKPDIDWKADVLTMDMPDPWLAFPNLDPYLKSGGRICVYVPNANQVFDSVNALRDMGYADIHSLENIQRGMDVHPGGVRPSFDTLGHTGYLVFGRKRSGRVL